MFIYFTCNNLHLLVPNSHSIPPQPHFPLAATGLFSTSMSVSLFCR